MLYSLKRAESHQRHETEHSTGAHCQYSESNILKLQREGLKSHSRGYLNLRMSFRSSKSRGAGPNSAGMSRGARPNFARIIRNQDVIRNHETLKQKHQKYLRRKRITKT